MSYESVGGGGGTPSGPAGGDLTGTYPDPTIAADAVDNTKLANMAANTVKGNATGSTADPQDISVGANTVLGRQGSNIVAAQVATGQIANDAVTYAKIQNISATSRVLGRKTSGAGDTEECTLSEILDFIGSAAQGDILYRDASAWARLGAGTSGQFLKTNGTSANPSWATVSATAVQYGIFQARMKLDSATQISLQRYAGNKVEINGEEVDPTASGLLCTTSDNLIAADGTDSGSGPSSSTLYYVYASNSSASFAATDLRLCATAPSLYNGTGYLATSGNGANWRFVGWIRTNGSTQFVDSATQAFVMNYYNRLPKKLFICPGYSDGSSATSYTFSSTTWARIRSSVPATDDILEYIDNGEDDTLWDFCAYIITDSRAMVIGFGDDSTTAIKNQQTISRGTGVNPCAATHYRRTKSTVAVRTMYAMGRVSSSLSVLADDGRSGAAADPPATFMSGVVYG